MSNRNITKFINNTPIPPTHPTHPTPLIKNTDNTKPNYKFFKKTDTHSSNDENSTPLTPEQIEKKQAAKEKALEDIERAKISNKEPQNLVINRTDGIRIELCDAYEQDIDTNDSDFSEIPSITNCKMIIIDETGEKYEIEADFGEAYGRDIKDLRSIKQKVGEFLEKVDISTIKNLISNKVENIRFDTEFIWPTESSLDKDGNAIEISNYGYATFVSPDFKPEPRKYSKYTSFTRDDGCKFKIKNISDTQSNLEIITPSGESLCFTLEGDDKDKYNQWQIPKFKKLLNDIPINVLRDLSNEIDTIKLMKCINVTNDGIYPLGSNVLGLKVDEGPFGVAPAITFVHELGHAIDNYNGSMQSKNNPEFVKKFNEFKSLAQNLGIDEHSITIPEEFFASTYAYYNIKDNSDSNHIANLDKIIDKYKNSENANEKKCYELFEQLKTDIKDIIEMTRKQDPSKRKDSSIRDMVKQEFSDIIAEMNKYPNYSEELIGQSIELEIIDRICRDDEEFSKTIESYKKKSKDDELPKVIQKCYEDIASRAIKLRDKINNK